MVLCFYWLNVIFKTLWLASFVYAFTGWIWYIKTLWLARFVFYFVLQLNRLNHHFSVFVQLIAVTAVFSVICLSIAHVLPWFLYLPWFTYYLYVTVTILVYPLIVYVTVTKLFELLCNSCFMLCLELAIITIWMLWNILVMLLSLLKYRKFHWQPSWIFIAFLFHWVNKGIIFILLVYNC